MDLVVPTSSEDRPGVSNAEAIARLAHAGQVDKAGKPYVDHLARVVAILGRRFPDASPDEKEAAWLHDVLEDTDLTEDDLRSKGVSTQVIAIVRLLTRPPGIAYLDWIRQLSRSGSRAAVRVKLADNEDNQSPERVRALADGARMVAERYGPAREILLHAI